MNKIGSMYKDGIRGVVPKDTKKALEWYKRAAELGSVEAHFNMAHM